MKHLRLAAATLATAFLLSGCISNKVKEAESTISAQALINKAEQEHRSQQHERNEEFMAQIPEWALKTKAPDQHGIYAIGIADGGTVQLALKKSKLQAEFSLAQSFRQEVSGAERSIQEESSNHLSINKYIELIDKLVERVPVVGAEVVEQELISSPSTGLYTSFVLIKLPYNEINRVLQEQQSQSSDKKIQAYFDDLERRIDKRRSQRIEEERLKQEMANESLKNRSDLINSAANTLADDTPDQPSSPETNIASAPQE